MLLVQKYLETHSFNELAEEHGVYPSFSKSGHKWSLNYDQLEAKDDDPIAQECRGLILACHDGRDLSKEAVPGENRLSFGHIVPGKTEIVAFPMKRFFNYGQGAAADINFDDPELVIMDKLDGTLCIVYWDRFSKNWCVATRSVPEADIPLDSGIFTFRTLFEKAVHETLKVSFEEFSDILDKNFTYCFELTTPYNRIVVAYPDCKITLLAVRDLSSLQELGADSMLPAIPHVRMYAYSSITQLVEWVSTLDPSQNEGVVVRDADFNRIKIKNAAYVAASKVRDALATSPRNCLEIVMLGKEDDAASLLPEELAKNLMNIKEKYVIWLKEQEHLVSKVFEEAGSLGSDKKTFALTVQKYKPSMPAIFYTIYDKKAESVKDFIAKNRKDGTWANGFLDKILQSLKL